MSEKKAPDVSYKGTDDDRNGYFVTYTQIAIAVVVVIVLTVTVGLIAGLTGHAGSGGQTSTTGTTAATAASTSATQTGTQMATTKATMKPTQGQTVQPTTPAPPPYPELANIRLPTTVKPSEYYFELDVDMTSLSFTGSNVIQFSVTASTTLIIVHVDGINVTATPQISTDRYFNGGLQTVSAHGTYKKNNYHYTVLANPIVFGTYYIRYIYRANLSNDLNGFYKYQYTRASDRETV